MTPDLLQDAIGDGGVLVLRLNRPDKRNALATPLLQLVAEALGAADRDANVRAVVITGSDTIFAAGADIGEIEVATSDDPVESPRFAAWAAIRAFSKPLIGAVEGWCLGAGMELALRCDILIAGEKARFGQPETNLGFLPGAGGTAILTRIVGQQRAMAMVLSGEPISAAEALDARLILRVVPDGTAADAAIEFAAKLANRAPLALRTAKASIRRAMEAPLGEHLLEERRAFIGLMSEAEKIEGVAAFREKRAPVWPKS